MAEELAMKDLQMKTLTDKITNILAKLPKAQKNGKSEPLVIECGNKLKEFQIAFDSSQIELRQLGNLLDNKSEVKQALREHKAALKDLKAEYEQWKSGSVKDQLLGDHVEEGPDRTNPDTLMQHGLDVQDQSKQSLQRTLGVVHETKDVAVDTIAKLEANTEQIAGMSDKLDEIESTLQRSTKIIRRLARKMATDKYIWVFSLLVLGAIIALIVVQKVKSSGSVSAAVASVTSSACSAASQSGGVCATTAPTVAPNSKHFDLLKGVHVYQSTSYAQLDKLQQLIRQSD